MKAPSDFRHGNDGGIARASEFHGMQEFARTPANLDISADAVDLARMTAGEVSAAITHSRPFSWGRVPLPRAMTIRFGTPLPPSSFRHAASSDLEGEIRKCKM